MDCIVEIESLTKKYTEDLALDNISFILGKGQILGVVGPNGAGKTTLINSMCGLVSVDNGKLNYFGRSFSQSDIDLKKQLGVLTDNLGLFEELRGEEYLYFVARIYGLSKEAAKTRSEELFEFMDMADMKHKYIHQYSSGMQKKLAVSGALIHKPRILLLDEPFENIDPVATRSIIKVLKKMAGKGTTIVVTSHILSSIEQLCSDIFILYKGRKVVFDNINIVKDFLIKEVNVKSATSLENLFVGLMKKGQKEKVLSFI